MPLENIELTNFRNHKNLKINLEPNITVIVGPNGSGKTNILEAISLLSVGKSHRASAEADMINIDSNFARLVGITNQNDKLEVILNRKENSNRIAKTYKFNSSIKKASQFVGQLKTILFTPEDIRLVAGSPSRRREHLDRLLSQMEPKYKTSLSKYGRVLRHRNKVLELAQGQILQNIHQKQLDVWNEQLLETGQFIQKKRDEFFNYSKDHLAEISSQLYSDGYKLSFNYKKSTLNKDRMSEVERRELIYGTTQIGPHRDDYEFILDIKGKSYNLKSFGSRGQQRTGVLSLKILELEYLESQTEEKPMLLLDDIFSELDTDYRFAIKKICENRQVLITTADIEMVPKELNHKQILLS